jgi:hypothetical protein
MSSKRSRVAKATNKMCRDKASYDNFFSATRAAQRMKNQGTFFQLRPYHCPYCNRFHLTKNMKVFKKY